MIKELNLSTCVKDTKDVALVCNKKRSSSFIYYNKCAAFVLLLNFSIQFMWFNIKIFGVNPLTFPTAIRSDKGPNLIS